MAADPQSLALSAGAAPNLPPDVHLAIASQGLGASDTIDTAQSIQAYGDAATQVSILNNYTDQAKRDAWNAASPDQQAQWASAGFVAPDPTPVHHDGFLGRVVHDVAMGLDAVGSAVESIPGVKPVVHAVGTGLSEVGSSALDALGSGLQFTAHAYRTGEYHNETHDSLLGANPITNLLSGIGGTVAAGLSIHRLGGSSDWADAWHQTTVGDQTFNPNRVNDIENKFNLSAQDLALAKAAAGSTQDVQNFLQAQRQGGMSPADVTALRDKLTNPQDPQYADLQEAVQELKDSKLSFGRSLIPQSLWTSNHTLAEGLSGAGDALFSFADPFLVAGKVTKAVKVFRYGYDSFEKLQEVAQKPAVQKYIQSVVDTLNSGGVKAVMDRFPKLAPVAGYLGQQRDISGKVTRSGVTGAEDLTNRMIPGDASAVLEAVQSQEQADQRLSDLGRNPLEGNLPGAGDGLKPKSWRVQSEAMSGDSTAREAYAQAQQMADLAKANTAEKMTEYIVNNAWALHIASQPSQGIGLGTKAVLRLMGHSGNTQMAPTLTRTGRAFLAAKGTMQNAIDFSADKGISVGEGGAVDAVGRVLNKVVLNPMGATLRKTANILPTAMTFDANSPEALQVVKQFATMYLPASATARIVNMYAAAGDIGTKRRIVNDMFGQTFAAAGIDPQHPLAQHFIGELDKATIRQKYSVNGIDNMANGSGSVEAHGLLEKHMSHVWALPSFQDMATAANRSTLNKMVYGVANNQLATAFSKFWKPVQLLRVGFPVRVSIEELAGGTAREGPVALAQAALARQATMGVTGYHGPLAGLDPLGRMASLALRALPESARNKVTDLHELQAAVLARRAVDTTRSSLANGFNTVAAKVPGVSSIMDTIKYYNNSLFSHALTGEWSAQHGRKAMLSNNPEDELDNVKDGMRKTVLLGRTPGTAVRPNGDWMQYERGTPGYMSMWMGMLDDLAESGVARHLMFNIGLNRGALRETTADYLQSPQFRKYWNQAARANATADGRVVGEEVTSRNAAQDWANKLIDHVTALTHSPNPKNENGPVPIPGLIESLLKTGKAPDMATLKKIDVADRPQAVVGPEFVELPLGGVGGVLRDFADRGFARIGNAIDYFSRQPLYITAVHKAHTQLKPLVESIFGTESPAAEEVLTALVRTRANNEVLPFIHRPELRSQMNVLTQNLAPFQFAQEQFWKRWARTFVHSPEAFREAQLAHHALGATGITHTDDTGQEIFTYPASGFVQKALVDTFQALGVPASLPIKQAFTGQLKMVAPGADTSREFVPSFGPLVSLPMDFIARQWHPFIPVEQKVLGPLGADRPLWEEVVPSSVARLVNTAIAADATSPSYANAQMKAIQDLYAAHQEPKTGLDANGNPLPMTAQQKQEWMRKIANWTRINMFARALLGFSAPASPQSAIGDTRIGQELKDLTAGKHGMNFSQAMQELTKRNPDAYPYLVFMSQAAGKEPLPATKEAQAALESNPNFYSENAGAAGFLLPQKSADGTFSQQAYKEQLLYTLRTKRTPAEFLDQMEYAQAAPDYYATRDAHTARVATLKGQALQDENNSYAKWKADYLNDHPVFADKLLSASAVVERNRTIANLQAALKDPRAPQNQQTKDIADLMATYQGHVDTLGQWARLTGTAVTNARKAETADFIDWAKTWLPHHTLATDVWNTLIRPTVEPGVSA